MQNHPLHKGAVLLREELQISGLTSPPPILSYVRNRITISKDNDLGDKVLK